MNRRLISFLIVSAFSFVLMMSAWDYCHPDPDKIDLKESALSLQPEKIKKPHHPCATLRDVYDVLPSVRIFQSREINCFYSDSNQLTGQSFSGKNFFGTDNSPPKRDIPFQEIPIFQLNSNLRI